jgi:flagellar hook-length control protein FliK
VELNTQSRSTRELSAERENRPVLGFQDMLSRELHENLNGDIVRHASIMLRDGGEGTIRLSLKPETLGTVKIRLEMAENKITGHIIVESDEAFRAFEQEIRGLEQAFRDSGFEGATLDMALAGDGGQGHPGQQGREEASPFFSERLAASTYDASVSGALEHPGEYQWINLLV